MPKRTDIKKIMIIGSGPIIIGQACEFDYSGTQACKALRKLGYTIVLVNSNPATIMTDPDIADATYIEPLNAKRLEEIIEIERPCAILPNLGGQSGLNLCAELHKLGILEQYKVKTIGVDMDAIERGEDRIAFKETMKRLGIDIPRSSPAYSVDEALGIAAELGYPVVVRPAYTMGGTGSGIAYAPDELRTISIRGIEASMVGQVLIEESVIGWEELEVEVIRDHSGKMITVCFIENIDPMGVHTGDSFCAAPMLTISKELQDRLQSYAYKIVDDIAVIGGTNVQFAHDPKTGRVTVIEINPRTSRSSALASKATGFPIAYVSALLAAGLTLNELPYYKGNNLSEYTPGTKDDYIAIKFARWAFEKFEGSIDKLGTQMRAVGEVMSLGKTYKEAFLKAIRSLENSRYGLGFVKNFNHIPKDELLVLLKTPSSERQFIMYEALRAGATVDELHELTHIKRYFIEQMKEILDTETAIISEGKNINPDLLRKAKQDGFADKYIASLTGLSEREIAKLRGEHQINKEWDVIRVSGIAEEFCYTYSTYNKAVNKTPKNKRKIMILGGGPNRIGQGIEFDYCCVHAAFALKKAGFDTIMINCNPETVSTDYETSDMLYFEPLTVEDVIAVYEREKPEGVIVSFGGQTPLNIASDLQELGAKIIGTAPEVIDLAEDRDRFRNIMDELNIPMPESSMASNIEEALAAAKKIGYPLMVRPSYVLGGRGMEVVRSEPELVRYVENAKDVTEGRPLLIDRFLIDAMECEADAISDGTTAFVPAVMQHIEYAGVHSGDSACVLPSIEISEKNLNTIYEYTAKIANELKVSGLMNMQYAISDDTVYVLEANPRASRTVPLVSKVCDINMIQTAVSVMIQELTGVKIDLSAQKRPELKHYGVKEAVFPFNMFQEVDPLLGPEMRSTGEVLGMADNFGMAYFKAQEATMTPLPLSGTVLISVADPDKDKVVMVAKDLCELDFTIFATEGTAKRLKDAGVECEVWRKLHEDKPNIGDLLISKNNQSIDLIINTPIGKKSLQDDSYIRKAAIRMKIPYVTTLTAAIASVEGIKAAKNKFTSSADKKTAKSLQEYHKK